MFNVSAATALRAIFEGVENPQNIYTAPGGLTLPVGERVMFVDAAAWMSRWLAGDLVEVVEKACAAEEGLAPGA
jgi:hypothetical protein